MAGFNEEVRKGCKLIPYVLETGKIIRKAFSILNGKPVATLLVLQ